MCQLNTSLYELKQSPGACFSSVLMDFELKRYRANHSVFYRQFYSGKILVIAYVDDTVIAGDNHKGIQQINSTIWTKFQATAFRPSEIFLDDEVARTWYGIYLCQKKYVLDILMELGC